MIIQIIRKWKLPVAMVIGVLLYYIFRVIVPQEDEVSFYTLISHYLQPTLIFSMLFLSFLRVDPRDLRPHRWHGILLFTQGGLFVLFSLLAATNFPFSILHFPPSTFNYKLLYEGAMLCFICPTATASAVIVRKLGGSLSGCVTYLILCNLMVSVLAPAFLSIVEPRAGLGFTTEFFMIMGKVFPLLLCPLFLALIVRHYLPKLKENLLKIADLPFYMWLVALALAITVTVRTIVESNIAITILLGLAIVSLMCCGVQFYLGRKIGRRWKQKSEEVSAITAGQAFGQKNTVFIIWMGLVFLDPVTSVVGGFYSIWHNIVNSIQLSKSLSPGPSPAGRGIDSEIKTKKGK